MSVSILTKTVGDFSLKIARSLFVPIKVVNCSPHFYSSLIVFLLAQNVHTSKGLSQDPIELRETGNQLLVYIVKFQIHFFNS